MTTTDKKADPFRITGVGLYREVGGGIATVTKLTGNKQPFSKWLGIDSEGSDSAWGDDGTRLAGSRFSLVKRLDEPAEEMSGLTGFVQVVGQHCRPITTNLKHADPFDYVIDLSKVPASAIVRPEPKVETRKVWLVLWKDGVITAHSAKPDVTGVSAIFEREIIFQIGEGLEAGK